MWQRSAILSERRGDHPNGSPGDDDVVASADRFEPRGEHLLQLLQLAGVDGRELDGELIAGVVQRALSGRELDDAVTVWELREEASSMDPS